MRGGFGFKLDLVSLDSLSGWAITLWFVQVKDSAGVINENYQLVPGGDEIAVTDENKDDYVRQYIAAKLVTFYEYVRGMCRLSLCRMLTRVAAYGGTYYFSCMVAAWQDPGRCICGGAIQRYSAAHAGAIHCRRVLAHAER